MALNSIPGITGVSSGISNAPIPSPFVLPQVVAPQTSTSGIMTAAQVQNQAQENIQENATNFSMSYSHDVPKYGFIIALATFTGYSALGGTSTQGTSIGDFVGNNVANIRSNFTGSIVLPVPAGSDMNDRQDVEYSQHKFGPGWGTAIPASSAAIQSFLAGTAALPSTDEIGGLAQQGGAALGASALNNPIGAGGLATVGMAVNQFQTVLLDGPTYKRYTFSFRMAPHNAQESTLIRDIIVRLRKAAAPALGAYGVFWNFPEIVQCAYIPQLDNVTQTYMYPFKPAVLTSVAVNYAPNGEVGAFYKGTTAPEALIISLSFLELEFWIRQNYGA